MWKTNTPVLLSSAKVYDCIVSSAASISLLLRITSSILILRYSKLKTSHENAVDRNNNLSRSEPNLKLILRLIAWTISASIKMLCQRTLSGKFSQWTVLHFTGIHVSPSQSYGRLNFLSSYDSHAGCIYSKYILKFGLITDLASALVLLLLYNKHDSNRKYFIPNIRLFLTSRLDLILRKVTL